MGSCPLIISRTINLEEMTVENLLLLSWWDAYWECHWSLCNDANGDRGERRGEMARLLHRVAGLEVWARRGEEWGWRRGLLDILLGRDS